MNPYSLPRQPSLTIREVLVWISGRPSPVTHHDVCRRFAISSTNGCVRLMKLHRWGYLRRRKSKIPPRVYTYELTDFGDRQAKKWRKRK